jgi:hypothetical protein
MPAEIAARFREARLQNTERNRRILHQLADLCTVFETAGIPVLVSKGLPLAHFYYRDLGLRVLFDIDLLIRGKDRDKALDLMRAARYVPFFPAQRIDREKILLWKPSEYAWDAERIFDPDRPVLVEMHTSLWQSDWHGFRLPSSLDIWIDPRDCVIEDVSLRVPSEENLVIHLALHYACNALESNARLMHLLDVGLLLRRGATDLNWPRILRAIEGDGLQGFCYLTLELARQLCGSVVPPQVLSGLRQGTPRGIVGWLESKGLEDALAMSIYEPDRSLIYDLHWNMASSWHARLRLLIYALRTAWQAETGQNRWFGFIRRNLTRLRHIIPRSRHRDKTSD